ncbi:MAG: flagellar biosynthesis protein FliQ [Pirellulales bacterium]
MTPQNAIDLGREALMMMLMTSAPVLVTGLVVGFVVGLFQAMTQIQEQTISFVPKLVAVVLVLSIMLPWLINQLVDYSHELISGIPGGL